MAATAATTTAQHSNSTSSDSIAVIPKTEKEIQAEAAHQKLKQAFEAQLKALPDKPPLSWHEGFRCGKIRLEKIYADNTIGKASLDVPHVEILDIDATAKSLEEYLYDKITFVVKTTYFHINESSLLITDPTPSIVNFLTGSDAKALNDCADQIQSLVNCGLQINTIMSASRGPMSLHLSNREIRFTLLWVALWTIQECQQSKPVMPPGVSQFVMRLLSMGADFHVGAEFCLGPARRQTCLKMLADITRRLILNPKTNMENRNYYLNLLIAQTVCAYASFSNKDTINVTEWLRRLIYDPKGITHLIYDPNRPSEPETNQTVEFEIIMPIMQEIEEQYGAGFAIVEAQQVPHNLPQPLLNLVKQYAGEDAIVQVGIDLAPHVKTVLDHLSIPSLTCSFIYKFCRSTQIISHPIQTVRKFIEDHLFHKCNNPYRVNGLSFLDIQPSSISSNSTVLSLYQRDPYNCQAFIPNPERYVYLEFGQYVATELRSYPIAEWHTNPMNSTINPLGNRFFVLPSSTSTAAASSSAAAAAVDCQAQQNDFTIRAAAAMTPAFTAATANSTSTTNATSTSTAAPGPLRPS